MSRIAQLAESPLTLSLSPEYRGEGTRKPRNNRGLYYADASFAWSGSLLAIIRLGRKNL
jgi:hypothetical protein